MRSITAATLLGGLLGGGLLGLGLIMAIHYFGQNTGRESSDPTQSVASALSSATTAPDLARNAEKSPEAEPNGAPSWREAYTRNNFKLGMTLTEFKQTPAAGLTNQKAHAVCSNDYKKESARFSQLTKSEDHSLFGYSTSLDDGIVKCKFLYDDGLSFSSNGVAILLGNTWPIEEAYYFFSSNNKDDPVLYLIAISIQSKDFADVADAYAVRYGSPTSVEEPTVTNGLGNTLVNTTLKYMNENSEIFLTRFYKTTERSMIMYNLIPVAGAVEKRSTEIHGRPADRL